MPPGDGTAADRVALLGLGSDGDRLRLDLEAAGFSVAISDGPDDVRVRLSNESVDCIVSSYRLNGTTGIDFADSIAEEHSDVPVILAVDNGSERIAARAVTANIADYVRMTEIDEDPGRLVQAVQSQITDDLEAPSVSTEYRTLVEHFQNGLVTQFDKSLRYTVVGGTGFGLKIVREITEAHGWDVTVTESERGGARFEFGLDPQDPSVSTAEPSPDETAGRDRTES